MDRQSCPEFRKLRVLIVGQRDSFAHILAANGTSFWEGNVWEFCLGDR